MKVSIIIPVYNEENDITEVIRRVKAVDIDKEIIVVDDASTDRSRVIIEQLKDVRKIFHDRNMGKGRAIRSGLSHVKGEVVLIQDADLEYDPGDYHRLLKPILEQRTNVVYGSRFLGGGRFLLASMVANRFLTFLTNLLFGGRLTDMETCYKVIKADLIKKLNLSSNHFEIEPEITTRLLKMGEKIVEVPVAYQGRSQGKKIGAIDGVAAVVNLVRWRFSR